MKLPVPHNFYTEVSEIGGIDKMALIAGREAIVMEIAKMPALIVTGGYIRAVDHHVNGYPDTFFISQEV